MADLNVEDFFKDCARVLDVLYRSFPTPTTVYVEDISGSEDTDEFGMHSKRYLSCFSTLLWLEAEGFIRYHEPIRQEAVDQAVLSNRSFILLSTPRTISGSEPTSHGAQIPAKIPASIAAEQRAHIAHIRSALKERDSVHLRYAVLAFLGDWQGT